MLRTFEDNQAFLKMNLRFVTAMDKKCLYKAQITDFRLNVRTYFMVTINYVYTLSLPEFRFPTYLKKTELNLDRVHFTISYMLSR